MLATVRFFTEFLLTNSWEWSRISYYDGQVENNGLGETGPLSTHKKNLQNTHQMISERAYWKGVRERNMFSVLKKAEDWSKEGLLFRNLVAEDLLC